ncbi:MAG TPA: hypothetical protein VLU46_12610, partial [Thermoanaerobaculia bacterium]|nr:hypothetical protein [Thermoanaerobaculia bacterium]
MPFLLALFLAIPTLLLPEQPVADLPAGPYAGGDPSAIATDGTNFLIVSTGIIKSYPVGQSAMLVDANANPLWKTSVGISREGMSAGAASNGREYLVAYADKAGSTKAVRLDLKGNMLDQTPIEILTGNANFQGTHPIDVLWNGNEFVVITTVGYPPVMTATRISESGAVLQNGIALLDNAVWPIHAAAGHGVTVFTWNDPTG